MEADAARSSFGRTADGSLCGIAFKKLEHLIAAKALKVMKPDGRAFIIVGANRNAGKISRGAQWGFENYLRSRYHVADTFEVDGDLYKKQLEDYRIGGSGKGDRQ